jgi:hypothetical protein
LFPSSILLFKHALHCVAWTLRKAAAGQTFALLARLFFVVAFLSLSPSSGFPLQFDFSSVYSRPYSLRKNHQSLLLLLPSTFPGNTRKRRKDGNRFGWITLFLLSPISTSLLLLLPPHFHPYSVIVLFFSFQKAIDMRNSIREALGSLACGIHAHRYY